MLTNVIGNGKVLIPAPFFFLSSSNGVQIHIMLIRKNDWLGTHVASAPTVAVKYWTVQMHIYHLLTWE